MTSINYESRKAQTVICQWCGQQAEIIWVHGHGQCSKCGTNIDECCRGEQCESQSQLDPEFHKERNND